MRKLRWQWEQVEYMLQSPLCSDRIWKKLSDEEKLQMHAERCLLAGETGVKVEVVE